MIDDLAAEHALCAIAVDSMYGAQLADVHGVRPEHFGSPPLRRLFAAAVARVEPDTIDQRVAALAALAGIEPSWVVDLIDAPRKCFRDDSGAYARRVLAAADRRAQMHAHLEGLAALGFDVDVAA